MAAKRTAAFCWYKVSAHTIGIQRTDGILLICVEASWAPAGNCRAAETAGKSSDIDSWDRIASVPEPRSLGVCVGVKKDSAKKFIDWLIRTVRKHTRS